MFSFIVNMSMVAFAIVNVPVSIATILMNMFFVYCMIFSQKGPVNSIKPLLNVLLWSLIGCNLILNILNLLFVFFDFVDPAPWIHILLAAGILFKHIRLFVYLALFVDRLFFLSEFLVRVIWEVSAMNLNSTRGHVNITSETTDLGIYILSHIDFWIRCCYFLLCLGIMLASSSVVYLWNHIKRMEENASSFSALRKKQQMKVTILGIIQGVLFFLASGWLMTEEFFAYFAVFMDQDAHLICTVMALYSLVTTILLGVGQANFYLMAKNIGRKLQTLKCPLP
uniref:Taste receptor type 2 n=1 Tax=Sinocyclocheilus anshuiensis TaxID=1608454 RepID=A0A671T7G8_9TELE